MFSIFNIFFGLIMVVALVGMILCAKKQHVNPKAKPASIGLLVVVIICAISIMVHNMGNADNSDLLANEIVYLKSAAYTLGKKLAELSPDAKVLYLVAMVDGNERQTEMIEAFKEGCGTKITEIKVISPYGQPSPDTMEMMDGFSAKDFNTLLSTNKGYNLIVSTIGLPCDLENMKLWTIFENTPKQCPKLALLKGSIPKVAPLIDAGLVKAVVYFKPKADFKKPASSDIQEAFNTRYILITKSNLKQMTQDYPNILKH